MEGGKKLESRKCINNDGLDRMFLEMHFYITIKMQSLHPDPGTLISEAQIFTYNNYQVAFWGFNELASQGVNRI